MEDLFGDLPPEASSSATTTASGSSAPHASFGGSATSLKPRTTLAGSCKCGGQRVVAGSVGLLLCVAAGSNRARLKSIDHPSIRSSIHPIDPTHTHSPPDAAPETPSPAPGWGHGARLRPGQDDSGFHPGAAD